MIYRITYKGEGKQRKKLASPVKNRAELMALRDSKRNLEMLDKARKGDDEAKGKLLQLAYNIGHVEGQIAGCKSVGSFFFHDVDCYLSEEIRVKSEESDEPVTSEEIKQLILSKKDEIGLVMLERSVGGGWHLVCRRVPKTTILENQVRVAMALHLEMDTNTKDLQRVCYSTSGAEEDLVYLDDAVFEEPMSAKECEEEYRYLKEREKKNLEDVPKGAKKANKHYRPWEEKGIGVEKGDTQGTVPAVIQNQQADSSSHQGQSPCVTEADERTRFVFRECMKEEGVEPEDFVIEGRRHNSVKNVLGLCNQLLSKEETQGVLKEMMPENWQDENIQQLVEAFYTDYYNPSQRLSLVQKRIFKESRGLTQGTGTLCSAGFAQMSQAPCEPEEEENLYYGRLPKMPQGVKESIDAVGPAMSMPVIVAVCPVIGMLATGVKLDVHGVKNTLNQISYIAGDFASGKGSIDPVIDAWLRELSAIEEVYQKQQDEWIAKKLEAKNKKDQPAELKLPMRLLTLNNTVANLAEQLANTDGRHAFSFTPEADTVAQKWKSSINDFSVMLRQSYDGSKYDREAKSAEAVHVHIKHLLWNVTMCGTPDALYRVISNYTDGLQSRIAVARTPDNTFAKLEDNPFVITTRQEERIYQVAHLLMLMQGQVVLPKLEAKGREWLEKIRLETIKNDDKVKARQRIRICVTTQRMTCCIMLCKVAEQLIAKHGFNGAEKMLKQQPEIWISMLQKAQTPQLLEVFNVIADYLMDCALFFFRDRIENAFRSRDYAGNNERQRNGKNDTIFSRLDFDFGFDSAMQHSISVKGTGVSINQVQQMLKNWKKQGLIVQTDSKKYRKVVGSCH